jgi:hypothetical protein
MRSTLLLLSLFLGTAHAQLSGKVSSKEEGGMEGVLVSAKRAATITVTVVSDAKAATAFLRRSYRPATTR